MKMIFCHIRRLLPAAVAVLTLCISCGSATTLAYGDNGGGDTSGSPGDNSQNHPSEVSIAYLRSLAAGLSTPIERPLSVIGTVTATDLFGEWYKSVHIEDSTGGIDIEIDAYSLYRTFALYDRVRIECHGLSLGRYGSTIQLGLPPTGEYTVDRISASDIGKYMSISSRADGDFEPVETSVSALEPSLVGRTVKIQALHSSAADAGMSWCMADPLNGGFTDTERTVEDDSGAVLTVSVRGTAIYADERIPDGRFTLCGILEYRSGAYALRIANRLIIAEYD